MREIKFRGRHIASGEWEYGYLVSPNVIGEVCEVLGGGQGLSWFCVIDPETVGQATGLKDKNGVEIYEGDCVFGVLDGIGVRKLEVKQNPTQGWYPLQGELFKTFRENCVVVGNIYQNPDLIKASQLTEGV